MSPIRTRNAGCLLALACLLAAVPAAGRDGEQLHLRLMHEADARQPWRVGLYGSAAEYCQPTIARTTLDGNDLSIELQAPRIGCNTSRDVPFLLKALPPATSPLQDGTVYRARVYSDADGISSLVAFRLLDTGSTIAAEPENGFWWSIPEDDTAPPSRSTGLNVESQGDRLAIGLYGFGDGGAPVWYFGNTRMSGRTASVPLLELAGGDPLFSPIGMQPAAHDGPRLELEFVSPARAHAWLVRSVDGRDVAVRALTVARTRFAAQPTALGNGRWVLVADDESAPLQFEFSEPSRENADTLRLTDPARDAVLECRGSPDDNLPRRCSLFVAGIELATFDRIGIDRFVGKRDNGASVRLMRISSRP